MSDAGQLADRYKRFRASKTFVAALSTFIASWVSLHFALGFDSEWGALNLILSIEASISMALFMMVADRQDAQQRKTLQLMLHLLEAQKAMLENAIEGGEQK